MMDAGLKTYKSNDIAQEFFGNKADELPTNSGGSVRKANETTDSFPFATQIWRPNESISANARWVTPEPEPDDITDLSHISVATTLAHLVSALLTTRDPHMVETLRYALAKFPQSEWIYINAVRTALALDAPLVARRLAELASERYPHHPEIMKIDKILQPPRVIPVKGKKVDVQANQGWLLQHRHEYKGHWVALLDGKLLAHSESADSLLEEVGSVKGTGILLTWVS